MYTDSRRKFSEYTYVPGLKYVMQCPEEGSDVWKLRISGKTVCYGPWNVIEPLWRTLCGFGGKSTLVK